MTTTRRRARVYLRLGCGPVGCSVPLLAPLAGILATMMLAAGCSTGKPQPAVTVTRTVAPSQASPTPTPSPSPSQPAGRLTMRQAKLAYVRIVDPYNRAGDAVNRDYADHAPFSQFLADSAREISVLRGVRRGLLAVHWPRKVQPYITALVITDLASDLRCFTAESRAASYSRVAIINDTNPDCSADTGANANQIRSMLGLPPLG